MPQQSQDEWEVVSQTPAPASAAGDEWTVVSQTPAKPKAGGPPERPGYFRRLGQSFGVPTSKQELMDAIPSIPKSLPEAGIDVFKAANPLLAPTIKNTEGYLWEAGRGLKRGYQEVKEAGTNIGEGGPILANVGKAASGGMEAATSLTPFIGPTIRTAGTDWFMKNYRGALGGMTGTILQLTGLLDDVRGKAAKFGDAVPERGVSRISTALDVAGGKGGEKSAAMLRDVGIAKNDLADIHRNSPVEGSGAAKFHDLAEKIEAKQERIWNEGHTPQIQRVDSAFSADTHAQSQMAANVASGAKSALPVELEDAALNETAQAAKWIQDTLDKPRTLKQWDGLLRNINNDIRGTRYEAFGPAGIAVRQAAAKAIRGEIDRVLVENGESGVKSFNQRWGALENIKTRAQERAVQLARMESKKGELPEWVHPYLFLHPDWGAITGLSANLSRLHRSPAGRLGSGLKELRRSGLESPPPPPFRLVGPPGRVQEPIQPTLPGATSPDVTELNFGPRGRRDVSFPANRQAVVKVGGITYVWDSTKRKWVQR